MSTPTPSFIIKSKSRVERDKNNREANRNEEEKKLNNAIFELFIFDLRTPYKEIDFWGVLELLVFHSFFTTLLLEGFSKLQNRTPNYSHFIIRSCHRLGIHPYSKWFNWHLKISSALYIFFIHVRKYSLRNK